jgi:hypothetical protein
MVFPKYTWSPFIIYCFWTGDNEMPDTRKQALAVMGSITQCKIVFVTKENLSQFILPDHPIHEAYQYLSEVHKSDYLRTYFMHFYGGGYSDVKFQSGSWIPSFHYMQRMNDAWICGYKEVSPEAVACDEVKDMWEQLIGNGCYICKPKTPLTTKWYTRMVALLDERLPELKAHPAKHPRDCKGNPNGYPMGWNEMLGKIFHKVCSEHTNHILHTLPSVIITRHPM